MCTVTIIPKGGKDFILTSNRDEAPNRLSSTPDIHSVDNVDILFPKDGVSGGTWVGVSEKKRVVCVLNGGFEIHQRKPSYRLSRGIVSKDLMVADDIVQTVMDYDFTEIEPFTIVIADWNDDLKFFELVWDGDAKHFTPLPLEPKIWSSATLYNSKMREERLQWFNAFKEDTMLNAPSLLNFHKTAGGENLDYGVVMNRGFVKTTSITQVEKNSDDVEMRYESLQSKVVSTKTFKVSSAINE